MKQSLKRRFGIMRIIAGTYRGKKIASPEDEHTRPTSDRVRENLFNILTHRFSFKDKAILDLFAGTGALGLEALSRGASYGTFVENHKPMFKILKENVRLFSQETVVVEQDVLSFLIQKSSKPYDLIFMDPPYGSVSWPEVIEKILKNNWLSASGMMVIETEKNAVLEDIKGIETKETRTYGKTTVFFLMK
jgi:16S rRNA (guanine966-N2)-methyltransferase